MNIKNNLKCTFVLLTSLFLSACADKEITPPTAVDIISLTAQQAQEHWDMHIKSTPPLTPFKAEGSLRFGEEGNTNRVTYVLWGNESNPIRLDILSPFGPLAHIYEGKNPNNINLDDVQFFIPSENTMLTHQNTIVALNVLGIDIPFNLLTLRKIFQGTFPLSENGMYFTNAYMYSNSNNYIYDVHYNLSSMFNGASVQLDESVENPFMGTWTLDENAKPILFSTQGWEITFAYKDMATNPYKISGMHENGNVFTIFVNSISVEPSYNEERFKLNIPADARIINLEHQHFNLN